MVLFWGWLLWLLLFWFEWGLVLGFVCLGFLFCGFFVVGLLFVLLFWFGVLFKCMVKEICLCGMFILSIFILMILFVLIILCGFEINLLVSVEICISLFWCMFILMNVLKLVMLLIIFFKIMFGLRLLMVLMFFLNVVVLNFGWGLWFGLFSFFRMFLIVGKLNVLLVKVFGDRFFRSLVLLMMLLIVIVVVFIILFIIGYVLGWIVEVLSGLVLFIMWRKFVVCLKVLGFKCLIFNSVFWFGKVLLVFLKLIMLCVRVLFKFDM